MRHLAAIGLATSALLFLGCGGGSDTPAQRANEALVEKLHREEAALEQQRQELKGKHLPPGPSAQDLKEQQAAERTE